MISEQEVRDVLPSDCWLTQYVYHGERNTTAPIGYHIATGLAILSMSCPSEYGMMYAGELRANLYSMLVGRSGDDQKSTALAIAKRILHKANPIFKGDQPGSPEGLLEGLQKQPQQLITYPEFGKFLAAAQKGYFEPIKAVLTDVWDCLDSSTVILTQNGWRDKNNVKKGDMVWSLNRDTQKLELVPVLDKGERQCYEGEKMFHIKGQRTDIRTTEGHVFWSKYWDHTKKKLSDNWLKLTGRDIMTRRSTYALPLTADNPDAFPGLPLTDDELKFIAWFMTDGGFQTKYGQHQTTIITISQAKEPTRDRIRELLDRLGYPYRETIARSDRVAYPNAKPLHIFSVKRKMGEPGGWDKLTPYLDKNVSPLLHLMTRRQFQVFWKEMILGDGEQAHTPGGGLLWADRQVQADAWTQMGVLRGFATAYSTRLTKNNHLMFRISMRDDSHWLKSVPCAKKATKPVLEDPKPGETVWCVTNKNGTLITRYNGRVVILGNCEPQQRRKVKDQIVSVPNPRLSMMVGCSIPYLEKHTDPSDWTGGFLGRWLIMYGQRERVNPDPVPDDTATEWLVQELQRRMSIQDIGVCAGLSPQAKQLWTEWYFDLEARKIPDVIAGAKTRVPAMARKAALLYAWDFGLPCQGDTWELDEVTLSYGIAVAELHLKSLVGLSGKLAEHDDARERRAFLECVPVGGAVRFSEVLRTLKIKSRKATDILAGLVIDGSLKRTILQGGGGDFVLSRPAGFEEGE